MAKWLYQVNAISQKGLLEALNWPGFLQELERTAESQTDQALQVLIDAGLPEENAMQIKQFVMQSSLQTTNRGRTAPPKEQAPAKVNTTKDLGMHGYE